MSKPIILGAKLNLKRNALNSVLEEIKAINTRSEEVLKAIDDAETDEELETVETTAEAIEAELELKTQEKTKLEEEIAELEAELEQINEKEPATQEMEGARNMENIKEVRSAIKAYVQSKGAERAGFTSVEGGALIPEEMLKPKEAPTEELDLTRFINVVPVKSGAGKYPVIKKSGSAMASVEELAANPELAKPAITEVLYDINTYRGYIPVSQEVIDDADYDVTGLIAAEIKDQERNTKNAAIAAVLKTATAKAVTGIDGLKGLKNKELKKVYNGKFIVTSSFYNAVDTLKDLDGRYLMQPDITADSGLRFLGKECEVVDDTMLGTAGALVGFYGDPKAFMTMFDRKAASVKWVDNDIYGQLLAGFVRFDVKKVDADAGFFFTYTAAV